MTSLLRRLERTVVHALSALDGIANRWWGWRHNPLYQSGTIVCALLLTILVTGVWLLLFYRVGAPWESVARLTANPWIGTWVRGLHRFASDAAVVATAVHALRLFGQGRSWGARTLAWVSGAALTALLFVCGWTGYVLVWDVFGAQLARELARLVDTLPILSEPLGRAFTGERPLPSVFFFITLFLHIGLPLLMGVTLWIHVKRLSRPTLLPPRGLLWGTIGLLTVAAVALPLRMAPKADPFQVPAAFPADLFFVFWMPLTSRLPAATAAVTLLALAAVVAFVPPLSRGRDRRRFVPSFVDEDICVGCVQCSIDCPYGAIQMVPRTAHAGVSERASAEVAHVDPALCVSCGICAASCAPMGVGPAGRTGRDQLTAVHAFLAAPTRVPGEIVTIACDHGAGQFAAALREAGSVVYPVTCAGLLHTSVVEMLIRGGAGGVLIASCPPRDCWNREGGTWLVERVHHGREAELQPRVDRGRVRIVHCGAGDAHAGLRALRTFAAEVATLGTPLTEPGVRPTLACEAGPVEERR